ncbi:MAG: hypothetical protein ABSH12_06170 [Endomicrobiales bacterium]|jgi:hypothetical protein
MNNYMLFCLKTIGALSAAATVIACYIPNQTILPHIEAIPGIIYSNQMHIGRAIVTGYAIDIEHPPAVFSTSAALPKTCAESSKSRAPIRLLMNSVLKSSSSLHAVVDTKKEVPQVQKPSYDELNPYIIDNAIRQSHKSYCLNLSKTIKEVSVTLISITPFEHKSILKFKIDNNSDKYFIPQNTAILETPAQIFLKQVIGGKESAFGFAVINAQDINRYTFTMIESGGSCRVYNILF